MDPKQLRDYLDRIGLDAAPDVSPRGLATMQRAHLQSVPFENMDIYEGCVPLSLDLDDLFDKVVVRRRGGICYELNLLFADALGTLGFDVGLRGGRHPKYGDDLDHLFALVTFAATGETYIADVGFAYNFACPLKLEVGTVQDDGRDRYRIDRAQEVGDGYLRLVRMPGLGIAKAPHPREACEKAGEMHGALGGACIAGLSEADVKASTAGPHREVEEELYTFGPREVTAADCRARCNWYCTSPASRFTQGPLVCIDAPNGRRTLSANHLVTTCGNMRMVEDIATPEQFERHLHELMP